MSARLVTDDLTALIAANREQNREFAGRNPRFVEGGAVYVALAVIFGAFGALLLLTKIFGGEEAVAQAFYIWMVALLVGAAILIVISTWGRKWTRQ